MRPSGLLSSSAQSSSGLDTPLNMSWAGRLSALLLLLLLPCLLLALPVLVPFACPLLWPLAGSSAGGPFTASLGKPATVSTCKKIQSTSVSVSQYRGKGPVKHAQGTVLVSQLCIDLSLLRAGACCPNQLPVLHGWAGQLGDFCAFVHQCIGAQLTSGCAAAAMSGSQRSCRALTGASDMGLRKVSHLVTPYMERVACSTVHSVRLSTSTASSAPRRLLSRAVHVVERCGGLWVMREGGPVGA